APSCRCTPSPLHGLPPALLPQRSRLALAAIAESSRLRWTFRVVRGNVAEEVLAAAHEVDLVCIGKMGRQPSIGSRLGPVARSVVAGAPRSVLLTKHTIQTRHGVGVLYEGTQAAVKALWAAAKLAREEGGLTVLIPAANGAAAQLLEDEAAQLLRSRGLSARYRWLDNSRADVQLQFLQADRDSLVVASADSPLARELLEEMDSSVLLVR
ncbi:MAG: universal stress protein, partial [Nitrospirae bacterium]